MFCDSEQEDSEQCPYLNKTRNFLLPKKKKKVYTSSKNFFTLEEELYI